MFSAAQTFAAGAQVKRSLPRVLNLAALYDLGVDIPDGEVVMVAGRSGSFKSGFVLYLVYKLGLPTIYFAADMDAKTVAYRLAAMATGETTKEVAQRAAADPAARDRYTQILAASPITFVYDQPITWDGVDEVLDAYVETWDRFPRIVVVDNFMDVQGAAAEYAEQMEAMQGITELCKELGATVIVLHHATDKTQKNTTQPPTRAEVKGGLSEKPSLSLSVALESDSNRFRIAPIKYRHGPADPMAERPALLYVEPETNLFYSAPPVPGLSAASLAKEIR